MASFVKGPNYVTPFGKNDGYLRSTQDIKVESYQCSALSLPAIIIDKFPGQKILQTGVVMAKITSGPEIGKVGPREAAGTNEGQTITVTGTPTGGTFTITLEGQTTAAVAYNAAHADVQAALEALSNVVPGDLVVTGGPGPGTPWVVTFSGTAFGGIDIPAMTVTGSLTGGSSPAVAVTTSTPGVAGATDGRQTTSNIVGINQTFLPWQLIDRDVEIGVIYEASLVSANLLELDPATGLYIPATSTTLTYLASRQSGLNLILAR